MIRELDEFLSPGSQMTVVVDPTLIDPAEARIELDLVNSTVDVRAMTGGAELLGELLGDERYDQGILLGYRRGLSPGDADARTLLTLMALRRQWPKGHPPEAAWSPRCSTSGTSTSPSWPAWTTSSSATSWRA